MENNHREADKKKHMADFDTFGSAGIGLGWHELQHRKRKSTIWAYLGFTVTVYQRETLPKFLRNSLLKNVSLHWIKGPAYLKSFGNLGRKHNLREQILH